MVATEMIENGDFESGLTDWDDTVPPVLNDTGPWSVSAFAHGGTKSVQGDFPRECIAQDFSSKFVFDDITSFTVWQWHDNPVTRIYLFFTDGTYIYWNVCGGGGVGCGYNNWNEVDLLAGVWIGQPEADYKYKVVSKIVLYVSWVGAGQVYMDDISIMAEPLEEEDIIIQDGGKTLVCNAIDWRERQACKVAVRDVPLRTTGSFVDTGTYTLKNRRLYITIRLTDAEKTTLQTTFDGTAQITITAGDWTYVGWFVTKPIIYEYGKDGSGNVKEWIVEMEFVLSSFTYSP